LPAKQNKKHFVDKSLHSTVLEIRSLKIQIWDSVLEINDDIKLFPVWMEEES
jgi:hypothetical protein